MEYQKCLVEVDEILKHLNMNEFNKIPQDIRNLISEKKDKNYIWRYDKSKSLSEQNIDRQTIAILSYLNMEYLLDEEQKLLMEEIHRTNEKKKRANKVNSGSKIEKEDFIEKETKKEGYLVKIHEDKWYKKVIAAFKNLFAH